MSELSYASPAPNDVEHVRILGICFYVLGGILAFFSCFPIIYIFMGIMFITGATSFAPSGPGPAPSPAMMGWIFIAIASVFIFLGWTISVLTFLAGRAIRAHRNHTFCIVVSAIICLWMPFGTVLGIFAFIVLMRPSVQAMFKRA